MERCDWGGVTGEVRTGRCECRRKLSAEERGAPKQQRWWGHPALVTLPPPPSPKARHALHAMAAAAAGASRAGLGVAAGLLPFPSAWNGASPGSKWRQIT